MTTERPRPLDLFPAVYWTLLERVRNEGTFRAAFSSAKEANTVKTDFNRFRKSVMEYRPNGWEAELCRDLMVRMRKEALEFIRKSNSPAIVSLKAQLENPLDDVVLDEEAEMLERLERDIASGNL